MKPKNSPWIFLITVLLILSACKKYPDGPLLSLHTKKHRVVGQWDVEYFGVNGNDSTAYLKSQSFYGKYDFSIEEVTQTKYVFAIENNGLNARGFWEFGNEKEIIRIHLEEVYLTGSAGPYRAIDQDWEIRRLKEKELWLKCNYNNKEYFVKFRLTKNNL